MPCRSITCYYSAMVIDNDNNSQISNQDEDPTMELEPLSEEACNQFMLSAVSPARSDSVSEIEGSIEDLVEAEAPISGESESVIRELRDELKFRVEMNSILQLGIDQLREKCDGQVEQVSGLEKTNEELSHELERSHRQTKKTKQKLAKARDGEQALLVNMRKLGNADTATAVIADQDGDIEELRNGISELTDTVSGLETQLEFATKNTDYLETRMSEASAENAKLLAELESKIAQIDDYKNEIAALRRISTRAEHTVADRAPGTEPGPSGQAEACWVLVELDGIDLNAHIIGNGVLTIGSSPDCDIQIQSKFISRHHAQLVQTRNGCVLGDLNSTNGTYINSRRINKRILRAGDLVTIGKERFRYEKRSAKSIMNEMSEHEFSLNPGGN